MPGQHHLLDQRQVRAEELRATCASKVLDCLHYSQGTCSAATILNSWRFWEKSRSLNRASELKAFGEKVNAEMKFEHARAQDQSSSWNWQYVGTEIVRLSQNLRQLSLSLVPE